MLVAPPPLLDISLGFPCSQYASPSITSPRTSLTASQRQHPSANAPVSPTAPSSRSPPPPPTARHPPNLHFSLTVPALKRSVPRIGLAPTAPSSSACRTICQYALLRRRKTFSRLASREIVRKIRRSCFCSLARRSVCWLGQL